MSVRKKPWRRCSHCKMVMELCICAQIPRLVSATKVIVMATRREWQVPTNTGRLAVQALVNSALLVRGIRDEPCDLQAHLMPDRPTLLLYPADEALPLTPGSLSQWGKGPFNLVVPDGSWRQTTKMRRRDPLLASFPLVKICAGSPSAYRVRHDTKEEGLATIEAIARALCILENDRGADIQQALELLLHTMVSRVLRSRGTALDA